MFVLLFSIITLKRLIT
ncbi:hypothetical protein D029_3207A, partial [Vibrio parahaemolyticus 970107]